ncbi:TRAP transporter large permease subunit, partial [Treponema pectinovorum]
MITIYTIVFLASLVITIMIGMPITYSLLLSGAATAIAIGGPATNAQTVAAQVMRGTDSVSMMALPFFILVGELMNRGGLTKRIINFCNIFVGRFRGGLG